MVPVKVAPDVPSTMTMVAEIPANAIIYLIDFSHLRPGCCIDDYAQTQGQLLTQSLFIIHICNIRANQLSTNKLEVSAEALLRWRGLGKDTLTCQMQHKSRLDNDGV